MNKMGEKWPPTGYISCMRFYQQRLKGTEYSIHEHTSYQSDKHSGMYQHDPTKTCRQLPIKKKLKKKQNKKKEDYRSRAIMM